MTKQCELFSKCACKHFYPDCTLSDKCFKLEKLMDGSIESELVLIGNTVYKKVGNINNMG